jgi:hypothetical protein
VNPIFANIGRTVMQNKVCFRRLQLFPKNKTMLYYYLTLHVSSYSQENI